MAFSFFQKISRALAGKSRIDDNTLDNIEEALIESDMGVDTTLKIVDNLQDRVARDKMMSFDELVTYLREEIDALLDAGAPADIVLDKKPYVILVVGVNGVGKTTTIGKLAHYFKEQGLKVMIGAADTFRAAAIDQLDIWAERAGVEIVKQKIGSDPASVAFDTVKSAVAKEADVVLIDTAGRLHNRIDLMNELSKIRNVCDKAFQGAPNEVMLVLDASTGQNAFQQAKEFAKATNISSLVLTKLDGTAKGGVVVGLIDQFHVPIKFIGIGEGIKDIKAFDRKEFVDSLFNPEDLKKQ
jgi:fused signal recognition particle receptor